jgi:TATA-box binding protein (TBP) (component of TFIID and TFIIIB)
MFTHIDPNDVKISTMTVTAYTNIKKIHVEEIIKLRQEEANFPDESFTLSTKRRFKNCLIFKVQFDSPLSKNKKRNVAMNIFSTGVFNITGVLCVEEAGTIVKYIYDKLKDRDLLEASDDILETNIQIKMINSSFSIGAFNLDLFELQKALNASNDSNDPEMIVKFNPSTHPGLQVKLKILDSYTTCIIFGSGKALITGAKSIASLGIAYDFMTKFIDEKYSLFCHIKPIAIKSSPKKRGRKRKIIDILIC